jgi:hypothetical protein
MFNMRHLALFAAGLIGMAGAAQAQSMGQPMGTSNEGGTYNQIQYGSDVEGRCGHAVAITDEYGFHYDGMGNRLNASGCVIAPPQTPTGGRAINR